MSPHCLCHRARIGRRLTTTCFALLLFLCCHHSPSSATTFNFSSIFGSSSSPLNIRVVDSAGPVDVDYDFTGTGSNGLPTIEIYEKLHQPSQGGTETNLWSDVEIEIRVTKGENGSAIDGINGAIDNIKDLINKIFGGGSNNQASNNSSPQEQDEWDGIDIGIDKFVKNKAGILIPQYRIVLGTGIGDNFVPSTSGDDLYILADPMPKEVSHYFESPPSLGEDYLQWTSNGGSKPGLNNKQEATFWFGVHVPVALFTQDSHDEDVWKARITIRQHTAVPEPATLVLSLWGIVTASGRLRRRPTA